MIAPARRRSPRADPGQRFSGELALPVWLRIRSWRNDPRPLPLAEPERSAGEDSIKVRRARQTQMGGRSRKPVFWQEQKMRCARAIREAAIFRNGAAVRAAAAPRRSVRRLKTIPESSGPPSLRRALRPHLNAERKNAWMSPVSRNAMKDRRMKVETGGVPPKPTPRSHRSATRCRQPPVRWCRERTAGRKIQKHRRHRKQRR